ncbi:MAG TPA: universal stress protein [Trueperaceae bacterium]|nr:universal stress protein [Trueperaceae bacterium]
MFERLLVPLDESTLAEQVLPHVALAARLGKPDITLLRVLEPPTSAGVDQPTDPVEWQLALDAAQSYLVGVQKSLGEVGVDAEILVVEGDPATSILQHMREQRTDLLAITTHGRGGMLGHSLGNVASKTLLRARANVLLVRSLHAARGQVPTLPDVASYANLLVPLDGSLRAEAGLAVAARISENVSSGMLLTHVVEGGRPIRRRLPDDAEQRITDDYRRSQRLGAEAYLASLTSELGNGARRVEATVVGEGDPVAAIDRLASERAIDLTVLTAHGETGSARWPYGSVALHSVVYGATTLLVVQDRAQDELSDTHTEQAARERQGHG